MANAKIKEKKEEEKIMETAKGSGTTHSFLYSTIKPAGTRYSTAKRIVRK